MGSCSKSVNQDEQKQIQDVNESCRSEGYAFYVTESIILFWGVLENVTLLWLFLREVKSLTASKVLGLNLAVMALLYLSILPFTLIFETLIKFHANDTSVYYDPVSTTKDIFNMFNLIGCPLLLTCMCIERYLAVMQPILYLRLRKWENLNRVSAAVWTITLSFCCGAGLTDATVMMSVASITISALFLVMLSCLGVVVRSLRQQSPAQTAQTRSSVKRRAVANLMFVAVPTVAFYLPALAVIPLLLYMFTCDMFSVLLCHILHLCTLLPRFGVVVGPTFYLSKARQVFCIKRNQKV